MEDHCVQQNLCTVLINLMAGRAINRHSERIQGCIQNHITDRLFSMVECGLEHALKFLRLCRFVQYQQHYEDKKHRGADQCECHSYWVAEGKGQNLYDLVCFYTGYSFLH